MKRTLTLILLASLLTSLAACGEASTDVQDTSDNAETTPAPEEFPAGIEPAQYDLPFNIYAPDFGMYQRYFFTDEAGSDVMSQAIYKRELLVEEHLGVDITYQLTGTIRDVHPAIQAMVLSDDDNIQMALTHCIMGIQAIVADGLLYDFNDFEYVDLTQPWYNKAGIDALELKGRNYFVVSDYMIADPNCVLVNFDILDQYPGAEDPYDLVKEGKWTIDAMMKLMSLATKDNGDGVWDINDQYGLATPNDWYANSFIYSSGLSLVEKDENGDFVLSFGNERTFDMAAKLTEMIDSPDTFVYHYNDNKYDETTLDISKGRSLFNITTVRDLYTLRDSEINFGLLPYPKLEESQDGYYNNDWSGMMCVPKTVKNTEMIGKVIELLSYFSGETTVPAYYETMLGEKLTRDPESMEMLEIIFDGIVFDGGYNYLGYGNNMYQFFYMPSTLIMQGNGANFASHLDRHKKGAETEIQNFNDVINNLE